STIILDPKQMEFTNALKIWGAFVPNEMPVMALFNSWLASGVLRPLTQSNAMGTTSDSGIASACSAKVRINLASTSSCNFFFCSSDKTDDFITKLSNGQANTFLNH